MVRFKNRYLIGELGLGLFTERKKERKGVTAGALLASIKKSVLNNFGEFGLGSAQSSLQVKWLDGKTGTNLFILRCSAATCQMVHMALTLLTEIGGNPVTITVKSTKGSIRTCQEAILKQHLIDSYRQFDAGSSSMHVALKEIKQEIMGLKP
mmetsp:Transcript_41331/g.54330  ORF Transcript_41331/g.54330 Transcript_41331/m.54330 type:complete len:152 (+) Transcript_41331:35-490(+)